MTAQQLLRELQSLGYTEMKIAKAITDMGFSISQPQVNRLKTGENKQTTYGKHLAIIKLHKKALRQKNKEVK